MVAVTISNLTVVSRLLWPGVGRIAIEEARQLPASLVVYRESQKKSHYPVDDINLTFIRNKDERHLLTPLFRQITAMYNRPRGPDATVDLDIIVQAVRKLNGHVLYHDQFAGLTGFLRRLLYDEDYALYMHETSLGREGKSVKRALNDALDRAIIRNAKVVFTNSYTNQRVLLKENHSTIVAYPGCYPRSSISLDRKPTIIAVSMWDKGRHPEIYVSLAKLIKCRMILIGSWADDEYMMSMKRQYSDIVTITGPVTEDVLSEFYQTSALYVRFGYGERGPGQGGIEALSNGIPVITNRGLGISELISDGENGFVISDIHEAADRINFLIRSEAIRKKMMQEAWKTGKQLTWSSHVNIIRKTLADNELFAK